MTLREQRKQTLENETTFAFDIDEVTEFVKGASEELFISYHYARKKRMLVQPRGGFPTYEKQFELYAALQEAGADILPLTVDSHTRLNDYRTANKMLQASKTTGKDMLNGYPLISHGYRSTRQMICHFGFPVSLRHGTPDARLLTEIAIASGIFEIEGGPLTYVLPYSKNFPLDKAFLYWQYVDQVCAQYSEKNRLINRESFGPLTATLVPPSITISIQLLEMLLSLDEETKSFSVSFSQQGSIIQDVVTAKVMRKLANHYARLYGHLDARIQLVYHQWMGAFPAKKDCADQLINVSTVIAWMVNADKIITKTRDEAAGIPSKESNARAVSSTLYTLQILEGLPCLSDEREEEVLTEEVTAIMEAVLGNAADTLWRKIFNSVKSGIIDVPFSPHIINMNRLITVRDENRNIRIAERGNVPIPQRCYDYEKSCCKVRSGAKDLVASIISDIGIMQ